MEMRIITTRVDQINFLVRCRIWYKTMARPQSFFLKLLSSTWFIALEIFLLASLLVSLAKQINKGYHLRQEQTALNQRLEAERNHQAELQKLLALLGSPTVQEKKVREQLGLQRPGEKVVVIEEDKLPSSVASTADQPNLSPWRLWQQYFWGN